MTGFLLAALVIQGFLLPNGFIDGGATGVSLLLARLTQRPLPVLLVAVNITFEFLTYS